MARSKAAEHLQELVRSLQQAVDRLQEGTLGLAGLEQGTEQARALYERLVVLRHKAREAAVAGERPQPAAASVPELAAAPGQDAAPSIRLDTRPPEAHPQQTSLIDAIAETEKASPPPKAPVPKAAPATAKAPLAADRPVTVADKLEHAPVADLRKAIALSQKFWFVAELFDNDRKRYEEAIDTLNGMAGWKEAEHYLKVEVVGKLPKPPGGEVAATFADLVQRRFS